MGQLEGPQALSMLLLMWWYNRKTANISSQEIRQSYQIYNGWYIGAVLDYFCGLRRYWAQLDITGQSVCQSYQVDYVDLVVTRYIAIQTRSECKHCEA